MDGGEADPAVGHEDGDLVDQAASDDGEGVPLKKGRYVMDIYLDDVHPEPEKKPSQLTINSVPIKGPPEKGCYQGQRSLRANWEAAW